MPVGTDKVTGSRKLLPTLWLLSEKWGCLRQRLCWCKRLGQWWEMDNRALDIVPPLLGSLWKGAPLWKSG